MRNKKLNNMKVDKNKIRVRGNLHSHSTNSDGSLRPRELINLYHSIGYDFLAITDHNYRTKTNSPYSDFIVLEGYEDTGKFHINHIEDSWNETGLGLTFLNHPNRWNLSIKEIKHIISRYNLLGVEIYNRDNEHRGKSLDCLHFANDDFHHPGMEGKSWIVVTMDKPFTKGNLLRAIRDGDFEPRQGEFPNEY